MQSSAITGNETISYDAGGGHIHVNFVDGPFDLSFDQRMAWVHRASDAIVSYYGKLPVPHLKITVEGRPREGVSGGRTFDDNDGGFISIGLGHSTSERDLKQDWMLTHEMAHLAFPSVAERHHWIEEGLATYIEPWARVSTGELSATKVWGDFIRDMPQGLPRSDDRGLDRTPTWGRTYWGGALYCLLADVEIHSRTKNKKGLRDALRAINAQANISTDDLSLERILKIGDKATGVTVLQDLYASMKDQPFPVDLDSLWRRLGLVGPTDVIRINDKAPLADVRKAIESGR